MVAAFRNNALPYPVYGVPYIVEFPIVNAANTGITSATGLDSKLIIDGEPAVDATNEAIEIGGGWYYLQLTAANMTCSSLSIEVSSSSSGALPVRMKLAPRKLVRLRAGTAQGGDTTYITLDATAGAVDDIWNGCLCVATIDTNIEARVITDYTGSNQRAGVTPDWNVTPDSDDTFVVYLPEGRQMPQCDVYAVESEAADTPDTLNVNVTAMATDVISADAVAAAAVTKIQSGLATAAALATIDDFLDTEIALILQNTGYILARVAGSATGAQTDAPIYAITKNGVTYTVTFSNVTSAGNRSAASLAAT